MERDTEQTVKKVIGTQKGELRGRYAIIVMCHLSLLNKRIASIYCCNYTSPCINFLLNLQLVLNVGRIPVIVMLYYCYISFPAKSQSKRQVDTTQRSTTASGFYPYGGKWGSLAPLVEIFFSFQKRFEWSKSLLFMFSPPDLVKFH